MTGETKTREFEPACRRMERLDPFYKAVWEKAFAEAIPISGTFELTPRCNFNCRMCYVHLQPERIAYYGREMNASDWIHTAEEAKEAGTTWLCVTGGEPLMHPEFPVIWKELCQMGFFITLQTNASLIEGKMAELLEQYPPKQAKVTLYGSNDEVYRQVCRVEQGFTRTDRGLQTLQELGIPVQLVTTVIRQNLEDVKKIAFYAWLHKLPWMATGGVKDSIRGADSQAREVRVQEKLDEQRKADIQYRMNSHPVDPERKPATYCRDYRLGYWVTWNGMMRFCSFMNEPNIPVRGQPFREAWKQLIQYEEELQWPEECRSCEAREVCFKCAGTLATEESRKCQMMKHYCFRLNSEREKRYE